MEANITISLEEFLYLLTHSTCYQHNNYGKHDSEERRSYDVNQESARTTVS
jgi:hypothetical protein